MKHYVSFPSFLLGMAKAIDQAYGERADRFEQWLKEIFFNAAPQPKKEDIHQDFLSELKKDKPDLLAIKAQFFGAIQPFYKMADDFFDTFKPYKKFFAFKKDVFQPVVGMNKISEGLLILTGGLATLVLCAVIAPFALAGCLLPKSPLKNQSKIFFTNYLSYPASWVVNGLARMIRGAAQVITSPLTWFLRIPFRGLLTAENYFAKDKNHKKNHKHHRIVTNQKNNPINANFLDSPNKSVYRQIKPVLSSANNSIELPNVVSDVSSDKQSNNTFVSINKTENEKSLNREVFLMQV